MLSGDSTPENVYKISKYAQQNSMPVFHFLLPFKNRLTSSVLTSLFARLSCVHLARTAGTDHLQWRLSAQRARVLSGGLKGTFLTQRHIIQQPPH